MDCKQNMSTKAQLLQVQLDVANAQNARLSEENGLLRHKLDMLTNDNRSTATVHFEAKIKAFDLENEHDRMYENLERLKKKYNKLHAAYLEKVKRCAALEDVFKRQKTLAGLVMKSAIEQRKNEQQVALAKRLSNSESENLEAKVAKLNSALDEAYDIIDELEFELESIDFLEMENQRLLNELSSIKSQYKKLPASVSEKVDGLHDDDEAPPCYQPDDHDEATARHRMRHEVASSTCESCFNDDDADSATLERAALTNSLLRTAKAESHCMRRELLRCRLQQTGRPKLDQ